VLIHFLCQETEELFGKEFCSINLNMLTHLPEQIQCFSPLWSHSMFSFESRIKTLKHTFNGSRNLVTQISDAFILKLYLTAQLSHIPELHTSTVMKPILQGKLSYTHHNKKYFSFERHRHLAFVKILPEENFGIILRFIVHTNKNVHAVVQLHNHSSLLGETALPPSTPPCFISTIDRFFALVDIAVTANTMTVPLSLLIPCFIVYEQLGQVCLATFLDSFEHS